MSRPVKQGLDYFPMDVNTDDKIELIEAKYGLVGFAIVVKLFQKIYREGYYISWNEERLLLFKKNVNESLETVKNVINDCLVYNIFNQELFDKYNILTSSGIQKRYFAACERRSVVEGIKDYIIVDINSINVALTQVNEYIGTQSKVNKNKVNKTKAELPFVDDYPFDKFWDMYNKKSDRSICERKYSKLSTTEKEKIFKHVPKYVLSTPEPKYRKNPATYLNNKCWNDEHLPNSSGPEAKKQWVSPTGGPV